MPNDTALLDVTAVQASSLARGILSSTEELARHTHVLIGVIVAAHNEAVMLAATLAALVRLAAFIPQLSRRWLSEVLPIVAR